MLFTTPYFGLSVLLSFAYIFVLEKERKLDVQKLPLYPVPRSRENLFLVLGEVHHPKKREPVENPQWLAIPERGLYTGIAVFGAIGSGKTSCCMYPYAEQVLAFQAQYPDRGPGALILEVKGDFCYKVKGLLEKYDRGGDYLEISLGSEIRYNPLHNDLDAYALAYGIASLLNNLFGKGKEPFWQQAYTNLVKFIILLHKTLFNYVTLFDVYECAINPGLLRERIHRGEEMFSTQHVLVDIDTVLAHKELDSFEWELVEPAHRMKAVQSDELDRLLKEQGVDFELMSESGEETNAGDPRKRAQFAAVKRWFDNDWMRIEPKLRTSIVEGISVFLSLFDDNPSSSTPSAHQRKPTVRRRIGTEDMADHCLSFLS
ncbi:MAG TPA: hypothetical protein VEX68_17475 [Bryobacteraceae bacterium]|nr:hypothetical protein [Bryobacteraceae bacterium]